MGTPGKLRLGSKCLGLLDVGAVLSAGAGFAWVSLSGAGRGHGSQYHMGYLLPDCGPGLQPESLFPHSGVAQGGMGAGM